MKAGEYFTPKRVLFVALFGALALAADQFKVFGLVGGDPKQYFTLLQFFGPVAGGFLGSVPGAAAALLAQIGAYLLSGREFSLINAARLLPMAFAAVYFAKYSSARKMDWILGVPIIAMLLFIAHPVGASVWYYAVMFWSIPLLVRLVPGDNLFLRSIGSTFTAHAVGGVAWIYAFNTPAAVWNALIPVVVVERLMFAAGIAGAFIVLNTVLDAAESWRPDFNARLSGVLQVDKRYSLARFVARA